MYLERSALTALLAARHLIEVFGTEQTAPIPCEQTSARPSARALASMMRWMRQRRILKPLNGGQW
jgi:hypothetical protein